MTWQLKETVRSLEHMSFELEEVFSTISLRPRLGDNGVAEDLVKIENLLPLIIKRVKENDT